MDQKNYYTDGHERADVIEYRKDVFLPAMAEYERRSTYWVEGGTGCSSDTSTGRKYCA